MQNSSLLKLLPSAQYWSAPGRSPLPAPGNPCPDLRLPAASCNAVKHPYPLPSLAMQAGASPPPRPPRTSQQDSHVGKARLSDCGGNGLYGSQHGVEQLCQLPGGSFDSPSLFHDKPREGQHICFEGGFVGHFCWVPVSLSSRLGWALSCCVEMPGSCFILRGSYWLHCQPEFIKMLPGPCDGVLRIAAHGLALRLLRDAGREPGTGSMAERAELPLRCSAHSYNSWCPDLSTHPHGTLGCF